MQKLLIILLWWMIPSVVFSQKEDDFLLMSEVDAQPPQSLKEFQDYIKKNVQYSPEALQQKASGRVWVQFIVEKDGSLSNIQIPPSARKMGFGCDEQVIRILNAYPYKWKPAQQKGQAVRVRKLMAIPLNAAEQ